MAALPVGLSLFFDNPWMLGSSLAFGLYCHYYVMPREEAYLERRFEEEYRQFKKASPRWLLLG